MSFPRKIVEFRPTGPDGARTEILFLGQSLPQSPAKRVAAGVALAFVALNVLVTLVYAFMAFAIYVFPWVLKVGVVAAVAVTALHFGLQLAGRQGFRPFYWPSREGFKRR